MKMVISTKIETIKIDGQFIMYKTKIKFKLLHLYHSLSKVEEFYA